MGTASCGSCHGGRQPWGVSSLFPPFVSLKLGAAGLLHKSLYPLKHLSSFRKDTVAEEQEKPHGLSAEKGGPRDITERGQLSSLALSGESLVKGR